MISNLDICNMALAQLGQAPISALEQNEERARRCRLFYDPVRQEVLRTHNWAFATAEADLALLDAEESKMDGYMYAYPQDCLFLRKVFTAGNIAHPVSFKELYRKDQQARVIICQAPQARAEYTRDVRDSSVFDPAFVKAFSLALAADLALTLSADPTLSQRILQKYTLALEEARRSNMTENFEQYTGQSVFVESR